LSKGTETKTRILDAALKVMTVYGVEGASMRDIAKEAHLNAASIYNYFASKEEIVKSFYSYYREQYEKVRPDIDALLRRVETDPPFEVLLGCDFHYPEEIQERMDSIFYVASRRTSSDPGSAEFVHDIIYVAPQNTVRPLLEEMIRLGKIEPMDIEAFINLLVYLTFGAAFLNLTPMKIGYEEWMASFGLLFSLIHPK
jgi:AcrR family transcriptional regulator